MPSQTVEMAAIFVGLVLAFLVLLKLVQKPATFPYVRAKPLLSKPEAVFWKTLLHVTEQSATQFVVLAKIRVADIIEPRKDLVGKARMSALGRIAQKHVDFVLVDPETHHVAIAIELDDASHARPDRQKRDEFVNKAFAAAKVPLLRYPSKDGLQNATRLREAIDALLNPEPTPRSEGRASAPATRVKAVGRWAS